MSLLTMIQETADRLRLPRPSTVVGNSDPQVQRLLSVAQEEGRKIARHTWQYLEVETTFTTVEDTSNPGTGQALYDLDTIAPGWDRQRNPTMWDRSGQNLVNGPITPAEMQTNKAYLPMNVYYEWRVIQNQLELYPPPAIGLTIAFEYVTEFWCRSEGGTLQESWQADTDVGLVPEWIMSLGIEWRYNQKTGIENWALQKAEYEELVIKQSAQGVSGRAIDLGGQDLFRQRRVPWGNWTDYSY